jgi:hypothetical protein
MDGSPANGYKPDHHLERRSQHERIVAVRQPPRSADPERVCKCYCSEWLTTGCDDLAIGNGPDRDLGNSTSGGSS